MAPPDLEDCTFSTCPVSVSPYGYQPSLAASACFLAWYALSLLACLAITAKARRGLGFGLLLATCCSLEGAAHACRIASSRDPWHLAWYNLALVFSTLAPVCLTAAIHLATAELAATLGAEHAPSSPRAYGRAALVANVVVLAAEALGLAVTLADPAPRAGLGPPARPGRWAVAGGLALQAGGLLLCLAYLAALLGRAGAASRRHGYVTFHHPGRALRLAAALVPGAAALALARAAHDVAVFAGGLGRGPAADQALSLGLGGGALAVAVGMAVSAHPGLWRDDSAPRGGGRPADAEVMAGEGRGGAAPKPRLSPEVAEQLDEVSRLILRNSSLMAASDAGSDSSKRSSLVGDYPTPGTGEAPDTEGLVAYHARQEELDIGLAR